MQPSASPEEKAVAAQQAQEAIEEITTELASGQKPDLKRTKNRRQSKISVVYFRSLVAPDAQGEGAVLLPPDRPVQLAMFAM